MMTAKHTPGPWFVGAQNDGLYIIDGPPSPAPYDGPIPREYGPNVIATPNWGVAEYEANARLIAAAPEMLAALKTVLDDLMTFHDSTGQGERALSEEAHSKLLTAIAKAEAAS
ncbi:MAG: hypothetical protein E5Y67_03280 [Mesorhizobium sp.]|uniref:hypothetical protein n=1 Tax=Mesorhizobium sp. TaxID=1871066 RepID=UPI0011FBDB1E|nr:hypothetical protein [Mesorhizobium sp.]TIM16229.1 MAG: hypothetical protein E5Y67_03280 [Mesorhizobium sp.]